MRAAGTTRHAMAGPLLAALGCHGALAWLALALPPHALPNTTDPPGVTLVVALRAAPAAKPAPWDGPIGADLHEARVPEHLDWPDPPAPPSPAPTPAPPVHPRSARAPHAAPATVPAAAPTTATPGTVDAGAVAAWQAALSAWIERHRRYPAAARFRQEEGVVLVRFALDPAGRVLRAEITGPSGSGALDRAALALLDGATLPPPPPALDPALLVVSVPIRYRLQ